MNYVKTAGQTGILFGFSTAGIYLQKAANLQVPGSIIGMIFLFVLLRIGWFRAEWIQAGSSFLLKNLSLLFVPGTVGLIDYLHLFNGSGIMSLAAAFISTFLVMAVSAFMTEKSLQRKKKKQSREGYES
ncbi:CidA/LrgA family protein [Metabacillus sp. 84]|uniref:CidA/LrgA family protein n=1 Tax=unclassified Metabacillus TaxID=2675274 RepID=UPI003CEBD779